MQQSGGYAPPLVMEDFEVRWLGKPLQALCLLMFQRLKPPLRDLLQGSLLRILSHWKLHQFQPINHGLKSADSTPTCTMPYCGKVWQSSYRGPSHGVQKKERNTCKRLDGTLSPVYMSDDLNKRRASIAYQALSLKRIGTILLSTLDI